MAVTGGKRHIRQAWRQQLGWLRRHPSVIGWLAFSSIVIMVPTLLLPRSVALVFLGAVISAMITGLWWLSMIGSGSYRLYVGGMAEDFTSQSLQALGRRGWRHLDGVEFIDFDVDHVAVGPGGVLAVETKWTDQAWDVAAPKRHRHLDQAIRQTSIGARRIRSFLSSEGVDVPVVPALVVWGPAVAGIEGGSRLVDGTVVLIGRQEDEWRADLEGQRVDAWRLDAAVHALEAYRAKHDAHARSTGR